jgi:hypothetical protein
MPTHPSIVVRVYTRSTLLRLAHRDIVLNQEKLRWDAQQNMS